MRETRQQIQPEDKIKARSAKHDRARVAINNGAMSKCGTEGSQ
jgi:hypothetical protein